MKELIFPRDEIVDFLNLCEVVSEHLDEFCDTDIDMINLALLRCVFVKDQIGQYYGSVWKSCTHPKISFKE